jgi:hypothetical protein
MPDSAWRAVRTRLGAFFANATGALDPGPRLALLEASASANADVRRIRGTPDESEFSAKLAQLLFIGALHQAGFEFHELPKRSGHKPDVTGTLLGVGSVSAEVYKPVDEATFEAYRAELSDALRLADVGWSYTADISWRTNPVTARLPDRSYKDRHLRITSVLDHLLSPARNASQAESYVATLPEEDLGLAATVRITNLTPWRSPRLDPTRLVIMGWNNNSWSLEASAYALANKIINKARQEQALSRHADCRILAVDCSTLRTTWDLTLTPDGRSIAVVCDAIAQRLGELPNALSGVVLWNPYVGPGQTRRVVAATRGVPARLYDALAGCEWGPLREEAGVLRLDSR